MVSVDINLGLYIAIPIALFGALLIYRDAKQRGMETADMWAAGFFGAFFLIPLLGGIIVLALYLQRRTPRRGQPQPVPAV